MAIGSPKRESNSKSKWDKRRPFYYKWWVWAIFVIVLVLLPIGVDRLFLIGQNEQLLNTTYDASAVLGYCAAVLTILSTIILGAVAANQAREANNMSKIMRNMEQAKMLSMISLPEKGITINERSIESPRSVVPGFKNPELIDLTMKGVSVKRAYHIDLQVHNNSDFPIVQLDAIPGGIEQGAKRFASKLCAIAEQLEKPIYIAEKSNKCVRIIVPSDIIKKLNVTELPIQLSFTNVVNMRTQAKLHISIDLQNRQGDHVDFVYKFRIAKITDVFEA